MPVEQESNSNSGTNNGKSSAKSAQDEAMARLRAKREAREKESAAAEAAKAISSAEADAVEFNKAQKKQTPKGMKIDQEKKAEEVEEAKEAAPPARKWEFFAEHTVAPGENLSKISEKYYGNQGYWKPLYDANQAVIGDNPNVIVPGQVLKIPKL